MSKVQRGALPLIVLFGLALRLVWIESRPLFYDEAFSYFLSIQTLPKIVAGTAADTMPPLYYFLLHVWALVGQSVWWLRSLNVLLSMAVIYLAYRLVKDLYGQAAGLWTALLVAVAPFHIFYAQEMRMYTLLALGLTGYAWCFLRLTRAQDDERIHWPFWVGLVLFGTVAMYSHNLAGFTIIVPTIFLAARRRWKMLLRLIAAQAVIGLLFLPWLALVPGQVQKIQTAFWTPRPGLVEILQLIIMFVTNLPLPVWGTALAAVVSLYLIVIALLEFRRNRWSDEGFWFLIGYAVAPGVILFGISYLMRPVFVPRAVIASSIAGYALLGRLAACGRSRIAGRMAVGMFVIAALAALPAQVLFHEFPRSPYRETAAWLSGQAQTGEVVLHENKLSFFSMHFYEPNLAQSFLPDVKGGGNDTLAPASAAAMELEPAVDAAGAVGDAARVDYVVFQKELDELHAAGVEQSPAQAWLESHYRLSTTKPSMICWFTSTFDNVE